MGFGVRVVEFRINRTRIKNDGQIGKEIRNNGG